MKCPYCAEEIKDEAVKCRHCGEWLNKKSLLSIGNLKSSFQSMKDFGKELSDGIYGENEFLIPSDDHPLQVDDLKLYKSKFTYKESTYAYNYITNLYFYNENFTQRVGFVQNTIKSATLKITVNNFCNFKNPLVKVHSATNTLLLSVGLKNIKKIINAYSILEKLTCEQRFALYLDKLTNGGCIEYADGIRIYKDGFIEQKGNRISLKNSFENNLFKAGVRSGPNNYNPYRYIIREEKGWFKPEINFQALWDANSILRICCKFDPTSVLNKGK